jgi:hypothetical protein
MENTCLLVSPCEASLSSLLASLTAFAGSGASGTCVPPLHTRSAAGYGELPLSPTSHPTLLHPSSPPAAPAAARSRLTLTTRYYTAAVDLFPLPAAAFAGSPAAALAALPSALGPAEALILVLDAQQPFEGALQAAATAWAAHCAEASTATLLAVSVGCTHLGGSGGSSSGGGGSGGGSGGGVDSEAGAAVQRGEPSAAAAAHLAAVQAWALDNGFEHIEAQCSAPSLGSAGREKFSVPRVLEALESTMWGCAVVHAPSAARAAPQLAAGGSAAAGILESAARHRAEGEGALGAEEGEEEGEEGAGAGGAAASAAPQRQPYLAPEFLGSGGSGGDAGGLTLEGEDLDALKAAMHALLPPEAGVGAAGDGGSSGAGSAASAARFEGLLGQALSIRNAAKEGGMSDSARREAAAAMMERLMAAMGLEEGEEEEEAKEEAGGAAAGAKKAGE